MRRVLGTLFLICGLAALAAAAMRMQVDSRRSIAAGAVALVGIAASLLTVAMPEFGLRRWVRGLLLGAIMLALAAAVAGWWGLRSTLPELEKQQARLQKTGQSEELEATSRNINAFREAGESVQLLAAALVVCGLSVGGLKAARPSGAIGGGTDATVDERG